MSSERELQIAEKEREIQKAYRGIYKKAVQGKSLRAAVNAQCLDCCAYQRKEVTLCTSLSCPLYAVRPYQEISQDGHNETQRHQSDDEPLHAYFQGTGIAGGRIITGFVLTERAGTAGSCNRDRR